MTRGHKRGSGERSNIYSENKFSNWAQFSPYDAEIDALPPWTKASLIFETGLGDHIAIVVRDTHPKFISPVSAEDVRDTLLRIPQEFLVGLTSVYLLGGTSKQDKVSLGKLFRYGCYDYRRIILHAFPKRLLSEHYEKLPPADFMQEYERIGATWTKDRDGWLFEFTPATLRAFYLYDVLLHEIGHHIDRQNSYRKNRAESERYANWFATFCDQKMGPK